MKKRKQQFALHCFAFLFATAILCVADVGSAQTMWQRRDSSNVFLFKDTSARKVGDLLTVVIRELTDVENKDERALAQDRTHGAGMDTKASAAGHAGAGGSAAAKLDVTTSRSHGFDGTSRYSVERGFSDRITVAVLDILPNGNLVIGGKRTRNVSGETRKLVVSGIVRPIDISADNTIESPYISNFQVNYQGYGQETVYTTSDWMMRTWRRVWPWH